MFTRRTALPAVVFALMATLVATAAGTLQTPEQFFGFKIGADHKLARWDRIVDYMKLAAANVRALTPDGRTVLLTADQHRRAALREVPRHRT